MHPDLESEQAYVDHAHAGLEEMRRHVERAGEAGIGEVEALVLEAWAAKRLVTFEDAERGLCFGRLDVVGIVRPLYVGRLWVHEVPPRGKGARVRPGVLVEPARIADGGVQGLRALYVALTRPTKALVVVHAEPLPKQLLPA